jgi:hypothetical protein
MKPAYCVPSLFHNSRVSVSKAALLATTMDEANDRFGEFAVTFGSVLETKEKIISPTWRPDGFRRVDVKRVYKKDNESST